MQQKNYFLTVSTIFSIIFVLHFLRIILGWEATIGDWSIPMWFSWVAVILAGYLAYSGFKLGKK